MKIKSYKLKYQIFLYMTVGVLIWIFTASLFDETLYYIEEKRGIEFPSKVFVLCNFIQAIFLVLINIPFLRFLIKHIDNPVQKIINSLNALAEGNYEAEIDFHSQNEFDLIKDAFNSMSKKLEAAEKIKQNAENERILLFANMAHDLKTPITSIIGFSKALSDGIIEDEAKKTEYIATINSKALKMNDLIDRLFEYVKLESAENQLHLENVDVAEILRNCIADVYTEYEEKQIKLEIDIPDTAIIKNVDRLELSRVYTNLLNNAIKHNPERISVNVYMDSAGNTMIADSGEVLSKELAEKLFTPFVSGDSSRQSSNGSGLGLALAYKIMKKHGGDISFFQSIDFPGCVIIPSGCKKCFVITI